MRNFTAFTDAVHPSDRPSSLFTLSAFHSPQERLEGAQVSVDLFASTFLETTGDPFAWASLILGGGGYRLGRLGAMGVMKSAPLAREISIGAGVAAEAMTYEMSRRGIDAVRGRGGSEDFRWQGEVGLKNGWAHSLVSFSLYRGAGSFAQGQNIVVQHLAQDAAMVAGHQVAGVLKLAEKPVEDLAEQFAHAEGVNWQIKAGMSLVHNGFPKIHSVEKSLDLSLRARGNEKPFSDLFHLSLDPSFAWSSSQGKISGASPKPFATKPLLSIHMGEGSGRVPPHEPGGAKALLYEALKKEFGDSLHKIFPHPAVHEEVLQSALDIPAELKDGSRHFLSALIHSNVKDPLGLYLTAVAVREVFRRNPLHGTGGSYEEALIHLFVEEALKDSDSGHRGFAFRFLHQSLSVGARAASLENLLQQFGYGQEHAQEPETNQITRSNMIDLYRRRSREGAFYPEDQFLRGLDFSLRSRYSGVALNRIFRVLMLPNPLDYKLDEFQPIPADDMGKHIAERRRSASVERVSDEIDATHHTAFIADRRLAAKVISIRESEYRYRVEDPMKKMQNRIGLQENIERYLQAEGGLNPKEKISQLLALLNLNPTPVTEQVVKDFQDGKFEIVLMSPAEFEHEAGGLPHFYPDSSSRLVREGPREIPQILLKDLPAGQPVEKAPFTQSANRVVSLLSELVREWERVRQSSLEGPLEQTNWKAMDLGRMMARDRLVSEMMVFLEGQRWRLTNGFFTEWELADRLGGVVRHARSFVERFMK